MSIGMAILVSVCEPVCERVAHKLLWTSHADCDSTHRVLDRPVAVLIQAKINQEFFF
jgi:hypothetical protein